MSDRDKAAFGSHRNSWKSAPQTEAPTEVPTMKERGFSFLVFGARRRASTRLVASASSSGQHSEEPRVVVMRASVAHKKLDGTQSMILCWCILVACFGETGSHPGVPSMLQRRVLAIPVAPYHGVIRHHATQKEVV